MNIVTKFTLLSFRKKLAIVIGIILVIALPLTIAIVKTQQDVRSKAGGQQVTLRFNPRGGIKTVGETFDVEVNTQSETANIAGIDGTIQFNPEVLEAIDYTLLWGGAGIIKQNDGNGHLHFVTVNNTSNSIVGTVPLAVIHFRAKAPGEALVQFVQENLEIVALGQTENIAEGTHEIASFTITDQIVPTNTPDPSISITPSTNPSPTITGTSPTTTPITSPSVSPTTAPTSIPPTTIPTPIGVCPTPPVLPGTVASTPPPGTTLIFTLELDGIGNLGNPNPLSCRRPFVAEIFDASDNPVGASLTGDVHYDPATKVYKGFTSPTTLTPGSYYVKIKIDKYLKKRVPGILTITGTGSVITVPPARLVVGDLYDTGDGLNVIDTRDFNVLLSCFGEKINNALCGSNKTRADLDENGSVDGVDLNIFLRSLFLKEGD